MRQAAASRDEQEANTGSFWWGPIDLGQCFATVGFQGAGVYLVVRQARARALGTTCRRNASQIRKGRQCLGTHSSGGGNFAPAAPMRSHLLQQLHVSGSGCENPEVTLWREPRSDAM